MTVNMNYIACSTFKMDKLDSIGDIKQFLNEVSSVPVANITLKVTGADGHWFEPSDDMTFETLGLIREKLNIQMLTSSKEDFATVEKIRFAQDECRHNNIDSIDFKDGVIVTRAGAFITSHGLHIEDQSSDEADEPVDDEKPSQSGYSTTTPPSLPADFDFLATNDKLLHLQSQLDFHNNSIKSIKSQMIYLRKELRSEDITLNVLLPSGSSRCITVQPKMTIKAVKGVLADEGVGEVGMIRLIKGNDELKNGRTVSGCKLMDGNMLTMVLSIQGGVKGKPVQKQNFMKMAKQMEAQSHITKSKDTKVDSIKKTNDACNALMVACDTNPLNAMRYLLEQNPAVNIKKSLDAYHASNNKDVRLQDCCEALFSPLIEAVKVDMAQYQGAIETCHCTFQCPD